MGSPSPRLNQRRTSYLHEPLRYLTDALETHKNAFDEWGH